ncbi:MAG: hypothetical protein F4026_03415 [Synechococcus sp. SB0669_bin_8]|nr:hypothetical protein [Synechococcus sp. SB0663_bin_10]MYG47099.1 hypothetical protein [Synechococcus sp. SB0675_bin_6]MYK91188.1 hypothetical protein [Synechococcus sp. SB0669_bin_8]
MHGQGELSREQRERIREKANQFARRWTRKHNLAEHKESQTFINEFFGIFDIDRFASNIEFEYNISRNGKNRRIDVFWPRVILIEHKTSGRNLNEAFDKQVKEYFDMLKEKDHPEYILISSFRLFRIYSTEDKKKIGSEYKWFFIEDLPNNIHLFHYFLDHEYEKISRVVEQSINEKLLEKLTEIEKSIKEVMQTTRYGILKLALAGSLLLTFGYLISDGQPRAWLESVIGGSTREESTR